MKILKYLAIILVFLIAMFLAKGLLTPEITYESSVSVNKTAKESWAVMSDETNLPDWIEGYKRSELVSGTKNTVGAVSNVYVENGDEEMVMQETITAVKEYELMAMTFTMDFMDMDYEMHLEENNGQTLIRTISSTRGNGIFSKAIISFMPKAMKEQEDKNLNNLKVLIEENTVDYFEETVEESFEATFE